jgi:hypothetical protein
MVVVYEVHLVFVVLSMETGDWGTAHRARLRSPLPVLRLLPRLMLSPVIKERCLIEYACQVQDSKSYRTIWRWSTSWAELYVLLHT